MDQKEVHPCTKLRTSTRPFVSNKLYAIYQYYYVFSTNKLLEGHQFLRRCVFLENKHVSNIHSQYCVLPLQNIRYACCRISLNPFIFSAVYVVLLIPFPTPLNWRDGIFSDFHVRCRHIGSESRQHATPETMLKGKKKRNRYATPSLQITQQVKTKRDLLEDEETSHRLSCSRKQHDPSLCQEKGAPLTMWTNLCQCVASVISSSRKIISRSLYRVLCKLLDMYVLLITTVGVQIRMHTWENGVCMS